jgi:hypothetical protein
MTILATMFDSLRRFRKIVGRIRLYFVQEFLADGRLIRVVGPQDAQALPLLKEKTLGQYDVIVDDAPTSPNQKEANWEIIATMLPAFKEQLMANPELLIATLEQSPLPSGFVEKIKAVLSQPPSEEDQERAEIEKAQVLAVIGKDQAAAKKGEADAAKIMAEIGLAPAEDPEKRMLEIHQMIADIQEKMGKAEKLKAETVKTQVETAMIPAQMQAEQEDNQRQLAENRRQADLNFAQKSEAAKQKATTE